MLPDTMAWSRSNIFLFRVLPLFVFVLGCAGETVEISRQDREFVYSEKEKARTPDGACTKMKTFHADADHDGFGDPKKPQQACVAPRDHVEDGTDCADDDPRAFPGQKQFFATARPDGSFDFDCDGQGSVRLTLRAVCEENPETKHCAASSGWDVRASDRIPGCGEAAEWAWNECRTELVTEAPATSVPPDPAAPPVISIPSPQKTVSRCWSGKLAWKKRQLCR
ncbi:hypothetical protein KKD52_12895 [Myxococcota bacterium]|jgi:hypothetical protein|nr:hypothetical protein [Myxococcota bacterium]MBU1413529.1 hypothetical protein [Myxococcota bacterium]MBU1511250.1 hypothetical protein [Myxococcota bacterium]PKN24289.1 MAG: hypothetical protein CVU65_12175 [Deltaproteobacteria bacterium HGW-Deltaproteobacteria-22]